MPEEHKEGAFKTTLWGGFKKEDVLAYIEELTKKELAEKQAQQERCESLRQELNDLESDRQLLLEKTKEVCAKLTQEEKKTAQMQEQLAQAEEQANSYKTRLFAREQEAVLLKADVQNLQSQMELLQQELERARTAHKQDEELRRSFEKQMEQEYAQKQKSLEDELLQSVRMQEQRLEIRQQELDRMKIDDL